MSQHGDYIDSLKYAVDDDYVILDDLGSTGVTEWRKEIILEFIDMRYESQKPTLITSNLSTNEIFEAYGKRAYSRLFCDETTLLDFGTIDWRRIEQMKEETRLKEEAEKRASGES